MAFVIFFLFFLSVSAQTNGCGHTNTRYPSQKTTSDWIVTSDSRNRTFSVRVPSNYNISFNTPLVFFLHGGGGSGKQAELFYGMDSVGESNNFVIVYPDGFQNTWNAGQCCGQAALNQIDDVGFMMNLITRVSDNLCINKNAIFSTGMSNGGLMSYRLACQKPDVFAAIASVAGTLMYPSCNPSTNYPIAIMEIHGTLDENVPWYGGQGCGSSNANFNPIPNTIASWTGFEHCSCTQWNGTCTTSYLNQGDGTCVSYGPCMNGTDVVLCTIDQGAHSWPGGFKPNSTDGCNSNVSTTFFASQNVWNFFKLHYKDGSGDDNMGFRVGSNPLWFTLAFISLWLLNRI